ncbi:unnamed protein product, partial [Polarella glacialis]
PKGGFDQLVQECRSAMLQRLESSGIRLRDAAPPSQRKALERWTAQLMDVVRKDRGRAEQQQKQKQQQQQQQQHQRQQPTTPTTTTTATTAAEGPGAPAPSCASSGSRSF